MNILLISETKRDDSFPSSQFLFDGFWKPYSLDKCSDDDGILLYIRDDIPSRRFSNSNKTESIFDIEMVNLCTYNPHKSNTSNHLQNLGKLLDNYIRNYDNILLLGDFNSEFSEPSLNNFRDICNLKYLRKSQIDIKTVTTLLKLIYF